LSGKIGSLKNYIIITPCKNEGGNLPSLVNSLVKQTIKPLVWLIVDDGSNDNTPILLKDFQNKYNWIKVLRLEESPRDLGLHLAEIMKKGFDYSIDFCNQSGLKYNYLGNVDGDMILPSSFFENLINEFENDPKLGIASGGTDYTIGNKKVRAKVSINEPSGGHMLIRRTCFEECGGIPLSYAMDSVVKAKARLRGWSTKRFEDNIATEIRDVSAADGYWKGYSHKGEIYYYLNHNPLHVGINILKYSFKKPYYCGIAYMSGYIGSFIRGKDRINDQEIRRYYRNKWKDNLKL
jgi:glycosyltransferase involved in cell wall biosynthesis